MTQRVVFFGLSETLASDPDYTALQPGFLTGITGIYIALRRAVARNAG